MSLFFISIIHIFKQFNTAKFQKEHSNMLIYSPAKINIGLQILKKRNDGYHDLSSLMLPIPFNDIIEIKQCPKNEIPFSFNNSGIHIPGTISDNLCYKAWSAFTSIHPSPNIQLHLHKQIPFGAGLGGGSSNAASVIKALNILNNTPMSSPDLEKLSAEIGSDCPLFIQNTPTIAEGRGNILTPANISLSDYHTVLIFPGFGVSTKEAYNSVVPNNDQADLKNLLAQPIKKWKDAVFNDFENSIFPLYPKIREIKEALYNAGAIYASMSGSGSSIYGIFNNKPTLPESLSELIVWQGKI